MEFILLTLDNGDRAIVRRDEIVSVKSYREKMEIINHYKQYSIVKMKDGTRITALNDFDTLFNSLNIK